MPEKASHHGEELLGGLLDELDAIAQKTATDAAGTADDWSKRRRHIRHPFRCECTVRFPGWNPDEIVTLSGRTRNLSRGGIGFVVKRLFALGDVVELQLHSAAAGSPNYLAGVVRFSRYAGDGYYEVGIELKAASNDPIFSDRPALASSLARALRDDAPTG